MTTAIPSLCLSFCLLSFLLSLTRARSAVLFSTDILLSPDSHSPRSVLGFALGLPMHCIDILLFVSFSLPSLDFSPACLPSLHRHRTFCLPPDRLVIVIALVLCFLPHSNLFSRVSPIFASRFLSCNLPLRHPYITSRLLMLVSLASVFAPFPSFALHERR